MRSEKRYPRIAGILVAAVLAAGLASGTVWADAGHDHGPAKAMTAMPDHQGGTLEEAAAGNSGTMKANGPTALLMPMMDPARGRKVFAAKGCVVCHAMNGVGGNLGPTLDMRGMGAMNPFDFAAKMWEGAEAMIVLQEEELGGRISLTGQDLADMIAFVHSPSEIAKFSKNDIPHKIWDVLQRTHGKGHSH